MCHFISIFCVIYLQYCHRIESRATLINFHCILIVMINTLPQNIATHWNKVVQFSDVVPNCFSCSRSLHNTRSEFSKYYYCFRKGIYIKPIIRVQTTYTKFLDWFKWFGLWRGSQMGWWKTLAVNKLVQGEPQKRWW